MYFVLCTKGSHESTNFENLKCSDQNLPNSSCSFPNHKSVFPQILTLHCHERQLLCTFLNQTLYTLHERDRSNCKFLRLLSAQIKIHQILLIFKTINRFSSSLFSIMGHKSSVHFQLIFYILSTRGAYERTNLVNFHLSSQKSDILHFDGLLF